MENVSYVKQRAREMFGWVPPEKRGLNPFLLKLSKKGFTSTAELKSYIHKNLIPRSFAQARKVRQEQNMSQSISGQETIDSATSKAARQVNKVETLSARNMDTTAYKQKVKKMISPHTTFKPKQPRVSQNHKGLSDMPLSLSQSLSMKMK